MKRKSIRLFINIKNTREGFHDKVLKADGGWIFNINEMTHIQIETKFPFMICVYPNVTMESPCLVLLLHLIVHALSLHHMAYSCSGIQ